jgi:citrate synthase
VFLIEGERYLEADEAAERLGVKPETLYAYVSRGRLRSFRRAVGRGRLYLERDIERLLTLQPPRGGAENAEEGAPPAADGDAIADSTDLPLPPADSWASER